MIDKIILAIVWLHSTFDYFYYIWGLLNFRNLSGLKKSCEKPHCFKCPLFQALLISCIYLRPSNFWWVKYRKKKSWNAFQGEWQMLQRFPETLVTSHWMKLALWFLPNSTEYKSVYLFILEGHSFFSLKLSELFSVLATENDVILITIIHMYGNTYFYFCFLKINK